MVHFADLVLAVYSLFDMDGTLVNSTDGVVGAWQLFAQQYPGIDVHDILSCACILDTRLRPLLRAEPIPKLLMVSGQSKISALIAGLRTPMS